MIHVTQREKIIKSKSGKRMISMVSPIYDESYVMCWIFEAIGQQLDILNKYVSEAKLQTNISTATWGIGFWEKEFGTTPRDGSTIEERRQAIINRLIVKWPISPRRLELYITQLAGRECQIEENTGDYVFDVLLTNNDGASNVIVGDIKKKIDTFKPAHLMYSTIFQSVYHIGISIETEYLRYTYYKAGEYKAGEIPMK